MSTPSNDSLNALPEKYFPRRLIVRNIIAAVLIVIDIVALIPAIPGAIIFVISAWLSSKIDDWAMPNGWVRQSDQGTIACWRYLRNRV